jgi:glutathione S-transferase
MVLKLYSISSAAGSTGLVALVLGEKKIPFELVAVDTAQREQKAPAHLARNSFGQIPVIVSGLPFLVAFR